MNIDIIMNNTYGVLTNRCSVEDILEQYSGKDAMFYGNPFEMTLEDVDEVINYFENTEEYEICSELVKYRNDLDLDLFLEKLRIRNGQTPY
jgi:ribonucleotide monophosphatase NagD (HAD superfamily)